MLDLSQLEWQDDPSLQQARQVHSSFVLSTKAYVFGGYEVDTVEAYEVGVDQEWSTLLHNPLVERFNAAITAIDQNSILVFSGWDKKDGYIFDANTEEVKPILGGRLDVKFQCFSQVHLVS